MGGISGFCEHRLIQEHNFPFLVVCLLQSTLHFLQHWCILTILEFDRFFGDIYCLTFDQIVLVDVTKSPGFDSLIWKLTMEHYTALSDAFGDPGFQCLFITKKLDVKLR